MPVLEGITEEYLWRCLDRLTYYAAMKFKKIGYYSKNGFRSLKGEDPSGVAVNAIISAIDGTRAYDKNQYPDFMDFLRGVVDSTISNALRSSEVKKCKTSLDVNYEASDTLKNRESDHEDVIGTLEMAEHVKMILYEEFDKDDIVKKILECSDAEIYDRAEMAEYLGVRPEDITNAKKKIGRAVDKKLANQKQEYRYVR